MDGKFKGEVKAFYVDASICAKGNKSFRLATLGSKGHVKSPLCSLLKRRNKNKNWLFGTELNFNYAKYYPADEYAMIIEYEKNNAI